MQKVSRLFTALLIIAVTASFVTQLPAKTEKVQWLTVAELQAAYAKNPKPILVDLYTSWCGWCKVMDRDTYGKDEVAAYINKRYYAVKFDAESKESVVWNGKTYNYNKDYKANELAVYLMYGQMSFPTTVFMPTLNDRPAPLAGYLKPEELESPLKFFGEGAYKTKNFPEFMKTFVVTWK